MARKTALVIGGLGVIGRNLINHLSTQDDWDIIAVSRRAPDEEMAKKAEFISCDLLDIKQAEQKLAGLADVTHMFCCALDGGIDATNTEQNRLLVANPVTVISSVAKNLERVVLQEGSKAYGRQLGPFKTPAFESDSRHMPPNFYYEQEDFLIEFQKGKNWTWAVLRPEAVCGFAVGNPMNLIMCFGVYAAISKELGMPLKYPGHLGGFDAINQVTDSGLLARMTVWSATSPNAGNEIFNITNGDGFRYVNVWPDWAKQFGMEVAMPQRIISSDVMTDKAPVWERIVEKHGLVPLPFEQTAGWPYFDFNMDTSWDVLMSDAKRIDRGFTEMVDTEAMFLRLFAEFRERKVLP
ncbi:MAG: SDR family oxidoreductase [Alphaproteobacteria bacterium]|jgi:nucleoside-diphosphate-sugar epimerase|nr:SDR family oxidoreductase [Alphaproteobacteria bacterium]